MQWITVSSRDLDWSDRRFCLSLNLPRPEVLFGEEDVPFPAILRPGLRPGSWTMVFGHSHWSHPENHSREWISALCLMPEEADERKCLYLAYGFRRRFGPLALMEKAFLVRRLCETGGYRPEELAGTWLKALELPPGPTTVEKMMRLASWPEPLVPIAEQAEINPAVLLQLAELPCSDAEAIVPFLQRHRWSHSRQKEVVRICLDLAKIQGTCLADIVADCRQVESALPGETAGPERAEAVRIHLLRLRYPRRREAEEQYEACRRKLRLPPEIRLAEPPDFDGEKYRIQFSFRSRRELDRAVESLARLARQEELDNLFRLV